MRTEIFRCRACNGKELTTVIDLGCQYVIDFVEKETGDTVPLELVKCGKCHLVQLKHTVDPKRLFTKFWYRSGISESMRAALQDVVKKAMVIGELNPGDHVLDIGANDGTMLSMYPHSVRTVGVEPCRNLATEAMKNKRMDNCVIGLFGTGGLKHEKTWAPYKIITAIAMFYDVEDPLQFLKDCKEILHPEGVVVIQMNYLKSMLENNAVDNICHEHLTYFSLTSLLPLCERAGLEAIGCETNAVNGGSIRLYLAHVENAAAGVGVGAQRRADLYTTMMQLQLEERRMGLDTDEPYRAFEERAQMVRTRLRNYLLEQHGHGRKLYLYGASTRGTVLMQYLDMPRGAFLAAAERDPHKYGLKMVGSWVPIEDEDTCRKDADIFLVLPWHFGEQIRKREEAWLAKGGELIFPLPTPRCVTFAAEYPVPDVMQEVLP